jgi:fructose-1,6-bisphosphatase/inositol monophosphatase family enzyme
VHDTKAVAGWILDVLGERMAVAMRGQGVTLDGRTLTLGAATDRPLVGYAGYRIRKEFDRQLPRAERGRVARLSTLNCAGAEYLELLSGGADFCIYRITKPWDHAAGALMMREAGGGAVRFDGAAYEPSQPINSGLITAPRSESLTQARDLFDAVRLPLLANLPKV